MSFFFPQGGPGGDPNSFQFCEAELSQQSNAGVQNFAARYSDAHNHPFWNDKSTSDHCC